MKLDNNSVTVALFAAATIVTCAYFWHATEVTNIRCTNNYEQRLDELGRVVWRKSHGPAPQVQEFSHNIFYARQIPTKGDTIVIGGR